MREVFTITIAFETTCLFESIRFFVWAEAWAEAKRDRGLEATRFCAIQQRLRTKACFYVVAISQDPRGEKKKKKSSQSNSNGRSQKKKKTNPVEEVAWLPKFTRLRSSVCPACPLFLKPEYLHIPRLPELCCVSRLKSIAVRLSAVFTL